MTEREGGRHQWHISRSSLKTLVTLSSCCTLKKYHFGISRLEVATLSKNNEPKMQLKTLLSNAEFLAYLNLRKINISYFLLLWWQKDPKCLLFKSSFFSTATDIYLGIFHRLLILTFFSLFKWKLKPLWYIL